MQALEDARPTKPRLQGPVQEIRKRTDILRVGGGALKFVRILPVLGNLGLDGGLQLKIAVNERFW